MHKIIGKFLNNYFFKANNYLNEKKTVITEKKVYQNLKIWPNLQLILKLDKKETLS